MGENGIGFVFVCIVILLGVGGESEKEVRGRRGRRMEGEVSQRRK